MKENDNFSCWCKAVRVNSSPTVTWMKNGRVLGEPSSTGQELNLRNVSNEASGIYVCRAQFYQLIHEEMIAITVQCKSFLNVYFCLLYFTIFIISKDALPPCKDLFYRYAPIVSCTNVYLSFV